MATEVWPVEPAELRWPKLRETSGDRGKGGRSGTAPGVVPEGVVVVLGRRSVVWVRLPALSCVWRPRERELSMLGLGKC